MSNWSVSIDNKTATSIQVSWQDLATLLSQSIFHYITVIKSSNGSIVNGNILQENTTSNVFYGLSPYMEYRLTLLCVNDNWEVYKSSEVTEWTEESGMIIPLPAQLCYWLPCLRKRRIEHIHDRPFPSCIKLLFQSEAKCKAIDIQ